jgi:peptidoglycan/xylan/chitin deacetylase (PgdA/CDA1 family)
VPLVLIGLLPGCSSPRAQSAPVVNRIPLRQQSARRRRTIEIVSNGQPSGVIELPIAEVSNDYVYYGETANGALPSPDAVFQIYKAEFDLAYQERTMFILTQHPHVGGRRSRIVNLDRLITYIKSKGDVWFATMEQVANYVKQQPRS